MSQAEGFVGVTVMTAASSPHSDHRECGLAARRLYCRMSGRQYTVTWLRCPGSLCIALPALEVLCVAFASYSRHGKGHGADQLRSVSSNSEVTVSGVVLTTRAYLCLD